ncbi:MAG: chorismate synthase [Candidatus Krumholzibacteria bacterium]|nr:chorismate synthase [Candidatus Krumholzibacteria bacterium]
MRSLTAGDSHGELLVGIIEGFPAGHRVSVRDIERDLSRRRKSYGRSARQNIERDSIKIVSGLWKGRTTGAPIAILVQNLGRTVSGKPGGALGSVPRPGHADLAGCLKYGFDEVPPISERSSARGTAMRVAFGSLAKSVLKLFAIEILGHVTSIGGVDADVAPVPFAKLKRSVSRSPLYCADKQAADKMIETIRVAKKEGNSLGGRVEVVATGLIPGLGTHVESDRKLDARLAGALVSIQSVKAVEIGDVLKTHRLKGFESHDAMYLDRGRVSRKTNHAGGIEGSMTNGEDIIMRLYAKPLPTSLKRLSSYDMKMMKSAKSPFVRSDVCVLPALTVIAEGVVAWELLLAMVEQFGGDSIDQMKANYGSYVTGLAKRGIL